MTGTVNEPSTSNAHTNNAQINKNKLNSIYKLNRSYSISNILNTSNEVFIEAEILDSKFDEVKNKSKHVLSSTS